MGYTMSFDASCKVQRSAVRGYLSHAARDVDRQNGVEVRHSNEDIDPTRTSDNVTLVYDAEAEEYRQCKDSNELVAALEKRLETVKRPLRKDAVVLRPVIMQLDPEWYKDNKNDDERINSYEKMLEWATDTFDAENVIGASLHLDETNPHLHILVTPVTDDGRLSQKDWFRGPAALRAMHDSLREHMRDSGFDVALQRKKPGKYAKRMDEREYKDFAELQKTRKALEKQQAALQAQQEAVRRRGRAVVSREKALEERERALEGRERAVEGRERAVAARARQVDQTCQEALDLSRRAAEDEARVIKWAEGKGWRKAADGIKGQTERREQKAVAVRSHAENIRLDPAFQDFKPGSSNYGLEL